MPSINHEVISKLIFNEPIEYTEFVESGTFRGETIANMEPIFDKLTTVEIDPKLYFNTKSAYKEFLREEKRETKITFLLGDSVDVFKSLLPTISNNTIFFLDGHYSGGDTGKGFRDVPILEECELVNSLFIHSAIVIIDDYRLFGTDNHDWTELTKEKIDKIFSKRIKKNFFINSELSEKDRLVYYLSPI